MIRFRSVWLLEAVCLTIFVVPVRAQTDGAQPKRGQRPSADAFFDRLDTNKDGKLVREELPERAAEFIIRADADGDGAVTKEELQKARESRTGRERSPGTDSLFDRFDANKDGKLVRAELPERAAQLIMGADANGDGAVTKAELQKARENRPDQRRRPSADEIMKRLDKNGDGKLAKEEIPAGFGERLKNADADDNGEVTKEELAKALERIGAGRGTPPQRREFDPAQLFQRLDRNGDGKVSKDELPGQMAERLMRADADGDGAISKEEFEKARQRRQGRGRQGAQPKS